MGVPKLRLNAQVWIATTDKGGDVAAARAQMQQDLEPFATKLMFDGVCLAHQYQILVFLILYLMDKVIAPAMGSELKYYSTLASIFHVWRDNAAGILWQWIGLYGAESLAFQTSVAFTVRDVANPCEG